MQKLFIKEGNIEHTYKTEDLTVSTVGLNVIFTFWNVEKETIESKTISLRTDSFKIYSFTEIFGKEVK